MPFALFGEYGLPWPFAAIAFVDGRLVMGIGTGVVTVATGEDSRCYKFMM